jgi:predicted nucleic acid-binding protein
MTYSLDSWAVIAWLDNVEPAASRVEKIMRQRPLISTVNVAEVYYVVKSKHGEVAAHQVIDSLRAQTRFLNADETVAVLAGQVKSENRMALGDAFAIATASLNDSILLTGDLEIVAAKGTWKIRDLRQQ